MRLLKPFEDYIGEGIVRKGTVNIERAKSLVEQSERKLTSLNQNLIKVGINEINSNDYVEHCYDILLFLIRAKLYSLGYSSSGQGAHEAEISYLNKLNFNEKDIQFIDQMRYFRNGIIYYGTSVDVEYAEKVVGFTKKIYPLLKDRCKV